MISITDNTVYIAGTHLGRASDWYDNILKVPSLWNVVPIVSPYKSCMLGTKTMPYTGEFARQADKAIPYVSTALKRVPLLAPEFEEVAMATDYQLGEVSTGLQATLHIANSASKTAQKVGKCS